MKPKKIRTERQKLDSQCLELWSKCVRAKQRTCRNCNSDHALQAHHIVQRTYKLSRYDINNGLCLCSRCHFPEHVDSEKFRRMVIPIIGEDEYKQMHDKYMITYKWTIAELRDIKEGLKRELNSSTQKAG